MESIIFNTGFIYQYGDNGIIDFGGEEDNIIDVCTITWNKKDIATAIVHIRRLEELMNLSEIDFTHYDNNVEGTNKLLNTLIQKGISKEYNMGCIIYHQLQYKVPLEATLMTGEPNLECYSDDNYSDSE